MHCYYIYWTNCLYATSVCFIPPTTVALYFSDYNIALGIGIKASGEYTWLNSKQVFFKLTQQNILDLKNILVLAERIKTLVSISFTVTLLSVTNLYPVYYFCSLHVSSQHLPSPWLPGQAHRTALDPGPSSQHGLPCCTCIWEFWDMCPLQDKQGV